MEWLSLLISPAGGSLELQLSGTKRIEQLAPLPGRLWPLFSRWHSPNHIWNYVFRVSNKCSHSVTLALLWRILHIGINEAWQTLSLSSPRMPPFFTNEMYETMSHLDLQRNGPLRAKSQPSTREFPLNSTIVDNKCLKMDFWFPAMCPAVFGWGLCTFYTGLLETLDAAARDRRRTQAAAEHLWHLWAGLRIYCLKSGSHGSFKCLQERLLFVNINHSIFEEEEIVFNDQ